MLLFFVFYNLVLISAAILLLPVILAAFLIQPKFRAGFFEKIGFYNIKPENKHTIMFHAVSVGEVNAVETLIKRTREEFPESRIVLTTTTKTGQEIARKKLSNTVDVITYFPYDFAFSVFSLLHKAKPDIILIAETEIWPDFMYIAKKMEIPVYIVNGRLSPNSYKGYKKFSFFFKPILGLYKGILMQTEGDAQRIRDVGAKPEITKVMGNLKFDINKNIDDAAIESLKNEMELAQNRLIIAASTHKGEDEILLDAFCEIKKEFPDVKFMIAPRHPERYESVENLIQNTGFSYGKRSSRDNFAQNEIIMLDTMGELMKFFSICTFAFIGGSFSSTGGHNPLEANIWDKPVLSGDCVFNFKDIYAFLTKTKAAKLVKTPEELKKAMKHLLEDEIYYKEACEDAAKIFDRNRGAVDFVIKTMKNE